MQTKTEDIYIKLPHNYTSMLGKLSEMCVFFKVQKHLNWQSKTGNDKGNTERLQLRQCLNFWSWFGLLYYEE